MKYILFFLLVSISSLSFCQTNISEMMKVYTMNFDQFETFALNKGYKFKDILDTNDQLEVSYVKGLGSNTKYIKLDLRSFGFGNRVTYQTASSAEFAKFKNEFINIGFKLVETTNFNGALEKEYILRNWKLKIYSGKDDYQYFEINLYKF